jgi:hypothetical protein
VEFFFVIYPVTHLPGKIAFSAKIRNEIMIGARNPRALSIITFNSAK